MKESLAKTLYDLVRAEQFVPFSILFASGQRFEIKSREHIGLGPVSRSDVEGLNAVIVWDDVGKWRSVTSRSSHYRRPTIPRRWQHTTQWQPRVDIPKYRRYR
jgi:hypothetical protein